MYIITYMNSMLPHIGSTLKALRVSKGLSQDALAAQTGISRITLIQVEKGKDARASSYEGVARALGTGIGILSESPELARRRLARTDQQAKLADSREKHLRLAVQFALGGSEALALRANALKMVNLWREKDLCSPVYIERWQKILDGSLEQVAQALLSMDREWGPALRQNTPFAVVQL